MRTVKEKQQASLGYYHRTKLARKEKIEQQRRLFRDKAKRECFEAYGNKCVCCGESNHGFLTIDHINNDGFKEKNGNRSRKRGGFIFCAWLRKQGWPKEFRLLCWNCNSGRAYTEDKQCPHLSNMAKTMGISAGLII